MTSSYELSAAADDDLQSIVAYTSERYGAQQALDYIDGLATCAENLASGYGYYKTLKDIHPALRVKRCQHQAEKQQQQATEDHGQFFADWKTRWAHGGGLWRLFCY